MYDKWSVLRVEIVINDPREFKIYRKVKKKGKPQKAWIRMGKSVSNIYRYAQISKASNLRYLNAFSSVEDTAQVRAELEAICNAVEKNGKRFSAFNPIAEESCRIFLSVLEEGNNINGLSNKTLRLELYPDVEYNSIEKKRVAGRISRLLQKMRAHKLIAKIPHSFRYKVTKRGIRIMAASLKIKRKELPKLLLTS